jgi:hypothetical protein
MYVYYILVRVCAFSWFSNSKYNNLHGMNDVKNHYVALNVTDVFAVF